MVELYLQSQVFKQIVRKATHISGSLLDHPLWCFKGPSFNMFNSLYCPPVASEVGSDVAQAPLRDQMANVISAFLFKEAPLKGSNFQLFNDLQCPPMASEIGSGVIRSRICGVKEQKLLVTFLSLRPPSWCCIESKYSHVERPPVASNGLGGRIRCDPVPICGVKEQKLLVHFCSQRPP